MPAPERDFDKQPYSPDEEKVAAYFCELGVGGGEDPVGFLLVSHAELGRQNRVLRQRLKAAGLPTEVNLDEEPEGAPVP